MKPCLRLTKAGLSDWCGQQMQSLVRKSSFSKAQGLHETGPWGSERPHSGYYINVTVGGLSHSSISWWHWLWASCAHRRLRSVMLHDIGAAVRLRTGV